jgi:hypothetical protein
MGNQSRRDALGWLAGMAAGASLLACGGSGNSPDAAPGSPASGDGSGSPPQSGVPFTFVAKGTAFTGYLHCGPQGALIASHRTIQVNGRGTLSADLKSVHFEYDELFGAASSSCPPWSGTVRNVNGTAAWEGDVLKCTCPVGSGGGSVYYFEFLRSGGGKVHVDYRFQDHTGQADGSIESPGL